MCWPPHCYRDGLTRLIDHQVTDYLSHCGYICSRTRYPRVDRQSQPQVVAGDTLGHCIADAPVLGTQVKFGRSIRTSLLLIQDAWEIIGENAGELGE